MLPSLAFYYQMCVLQVVPGKIHAVSPSLCRDVSWCTHTCAVGWAIKGVWQEGLAAGKATCVDRSHDLEILVRIKAGVKQE